MEVTLREATESDLELVMAWRSNPLVYEQMYLQKGPLVWEEHWKWWHTRDTSWKIFIIQCADTLTGLETGRRSVGVVQISRLDTQEPEVGIYIGETTLWGKGIGKEALLESHVFLSELGYKKVVAAILDSNERSKRLFTSLGYQYVGIANPSESLYRKELQ